MLKKIIYYFKMYMLFISKFVKARMAYRVDFCISILGIFMENTLGLMFYSVVFMRIPYIGGWGYYDLLFLYGFLITASSFFHIFCGNMFHLKSYLITGDFMKFYYRPLNMLFSFISETLDIKSIFQLMFGIYLLIVASKTLNMNWNLSKICILGLLVMSSGILITAVMIMCASLGFWVRDPSIIMDFMLKMKDYSKYPIEIYGKFIRAFFTFILPLGFMTYYPSLIFLRDTVNKHAWIISFQLTATIIFSAIAIFMFHKGTRTYDGVGS